MNLPIELYLDLRDNTISDVNTNPEVTQTFKLGVIKGVTITHISRDGTNTTTQNTPNVIAYKSSDGGTLSSDMVLTYFYLKQLKQSE